MKQVQIGHLNLGRLRDLLSGLAGSHSDRSENRVRSDKSVAERASLLLGSTRTAVEILRATERRWPGRY